MRAFVVIGAVACCLGGAFAQTVDPEGYWTAATVYRDEWGVPHVYADNPRALAFAFGYVQAEDHLDGMLKAYLAVNGRAAAVFGEAYADSDAFSIAVGHGRIAEAALAEADPVTEDLCVGFAQGVNAWIAEHPDKAPEWSEGVKPSDVLALWHAFLVSMAPFDLPNVYHRPRAMETGNAWALAPARTKDGKTLLVINPHMFYDGPFQWYEAHLVAGDLDVYGVALYGLPVIVQGYNAVMGWALTPNWPDFADVYAEDITGPARAPNDPRMSKMSTEEALTLEFMSNARPYYVRTESGLEERYVPALINSRGPVFDAGSGDLYSWRVGGFRDFGGLLQLIEMGRAQTVEAFQAACAMRQLPCFHILYADRQGNLFYLYNVTAGTRIIPEEVIERREKMALPPLDWQKPEPYAIDMTAWGELVPIERLPAVMNPESGYLQACGNPPWTATENSGLNPEDWAPWFIQDEDSMRAQRARRLLRSGQRSFRDMQAMVYDALAPAAVEMAPLLVQMAEARPELMKSLHPDAQTGIDLFRGWNGVSDTNSEAMTFYHAWWTALRAQTAGKFPHNQARYDALRANDTPAQDLALNAAGEAARNMRNAFDAMAIPWGDAHRLRRGKREEPAPGAASGEPLFLLADAAFENDKWYADYGFGCAIAIEFGDAPRAVSASIFGVSDRPESPHYSDQMDLVLGRRFKPTRYLREEVFRYAQSAFGRRILLMPPGVEGSVIVEAPSVVRAQARTSVDAPGALPEGIAPFTPYTRIQRDPGSVPVALYVELAVPETVCKPEDLSQLAVYAYEEGLGWYELPAQGLDTSRRALSARHDAAATYAVLGPEAFRTTPVDAPLPPPPAPEAAPAAETPATPSIWGDPGSDEGHTFNFNVLRPVRKREQPGETGAGPQGERRFHMEPLAPGQKSPVPPLIESGPGEPAAPEPQPEATTETPAPETAVQEPPAVAPEPVAGQAPPVAPIVATPEQNPEPEAAPEAPAAPPEVTPAPEGAPSGEVKPGGDGKRKFKVEIINKP